MVARGPAENEPPRIKSGAIQGEGVFLIPSRPEGPYRGTGYFSFATASGTSNALHQSQTSLNFAGSMLSGIR